MEFIQVVGQWCRDTFRDYVVFKKSILFILGLIFSYKLVENTFLNILLTHLKDYDFGSAVIVVNLQEGTSAVLVTMFAFVADVYSGRFKMVVFSTAVCIIGLLLASLAARNDKQLDLGLFYPALVLMTLAEAAQTVTLEAFLDNQLRPRYPTAAQDPDEDTSRRRRSNFWWLLVSSVAAIFVLFVPLTGLPLRRLAIVLALMMGGCFSFFFLGINYCNIVGRTQSPVIDVGVVILRAIKKRNVEYPETPEQLFQNPSRDLQVVPEVPWLRWLDRAAIVQENQPGIASSVEQVRGVKLLFKMLPLWSTFLILSLVDASGSTFFYEEAISITHNLIPILLLGMLQSFTEFVVSRMSNCVLKKLGKRVNNKYNQLRMELVRIGIGMLCCVVCCIVAWANAAYRSHLKEHMRLYWLIPQYLLLGLMGGLSGDGLQNFLESQVSESLPRFAPPFREFIVYCLLACYCYRDDHAFLLEDDEEMGIADQLVDGLTSETFHTPQDPLLGSQYSTKNYVLLRAVAAFLRLSRATRKHSKSQ